MTLYEKFRQLDMDVSPLGLEPDGARSGYFCTPEGAQVIGWEGVDGIHYCFVEGFGETVFAVNPSNPAGENVRPLARSFGDFLRLVLACGGTAAVEQAWMWNRGEFDGFLATYPPEPEQRAVLDALRDKLSLTPMDDPYGYIREVQSSFDYGKIPYSKEYYELIPEEPEPQGPPEKPEWRVYFANGFGSCHRGHDRPGKEIPLNKTVSWGGRVWHIPAAYACGKGIVVDLCVEIDPAALRAFVEKWEGTLDRQLTQEEQEQMDAENPMTVDYDPKVTVNGRALRQRSGTGSGWVPDCCRPEECRGERNQQDRENLWLMEHYGLDPGRGWMFWREAFPWATKTRPAVKTLSLSLEQRPTAVPGPRFTVSGAGDSVEFTHPATGEKHTLHVVEYESQEVDLSGMPDSEGWDYPTHCTAMSYVVEPELPREALAVRDSGQGDSPRPKPLGELAAISAIGGADGPIAACSVGIIGGSDGPTAILLASGSTSHPRPACSALRFEPTGRIEWRMVFYQKTVDGITVELLA